MITNTFLTVQLYCAVRIMVFYRRVSHHVWCAAQCTSATELQSRKVPMYQQRHLCTVFGRATFQGSWQKCNLPW